MERPNPSPHRPLRVLLLGVALVALLGLVAAVSRAHHTPGAAGGVHRPPAGVVDYVFSIFMVLAVAGTLFLLWWWFSERDLLVQSRKRRQQGGMYKAIVLLLLLGLIASVLARFNAGGLFRFIHRGRGDAQQGKTHMGRRPNAKKHPLPGEAPPPHLQWLPVVLATAAGMLLLGYIGVRTMKRARGALLEQHRLDREFEALLDDTLEDLYRQSDPRAAIIAAYARMEKLFASAGMPRHPSEAPLEYLRRALESLSASGAALGRLTGLFQWAKFSAHEVDDQMRVEALEAVTQVRDELRAKREEDKVRREEADRFRLEHQQHDPERTFSEDPFAAAADKAKGSIYGRRGV